MPWRLSPVMTIALAALAAAALSAEPPAATPSPATIERPVAPPGPNPSPAALPAAPDELPYVYTKWRHFTVQDGLPDDHIMAVKADGPRVWVGTEDGLACIDKPAGKIKTWEFKDQNNDGRADEPYSLPWKVITGTARGFHPLRALPGHPFRSKASSIHNANARRQHARSPYTGS